MRRLKCTKLLLGLIALFAIFGINLIGSNNAGAVDLSINATPTGNTWNFENNGGYCQSFIQSDQSRVNYQITAGSGWCFFSPDYTHEDVDSIGTRYNVPLVQGNYYVMDIYTLGYLKNNKAVAWNVTNNFNTYDLISFNLDWETSGWDYCNAWTSAYVSDQNFVNCAPTGMDVANMKAQKWTAILRAKVSGDNVISIGRLNEFAEVFRFVLGGSLRMGEIVEYETVINDGANKLNEKDDQDRNDMESVSEKSDSDAESSSAQAESTGTTLLAAFSSFVTALTNASPTSCKINMDMGNLNLGNVDFCTLSPPPAFQTIASILLIAFCVPLSIATARKVISLFRSFQS